MNFISSFFFANREEYLWIATFLPLIGLIALQKTSKDRYGEIDYLDLNDFSNDNYYVNNSLQYKMNITDLDDFDSHMLQTIE